MTRPRLCLAVCLLFLPVGASLAGMPLLPRIYTPFQLAECLEEHRDREFYEHIHKFATIDKSPALLFTLGLLYEYGIGVEMDRSEALRWYRRAAGAGYDFRPYLGKEAGAALARLEREGVPEEGPTARAAALLDAQTETGEEMRRLSLRYYYGIGAPVDHSRSESWEAKAAIKERLESLSRLTESLKARPGDSAATANARYRAQLGELMQGFGPSSDPENDTSPRASSSQTLMEYARDIYREGRRYHEGEGVPQDYLTAAVRYSEAAAFGIDEPLCNFYLADIQDRGLAGGDNPWSAGKNYRLAADGGHPESMVRLARLHEEGRGVRQSLSQARRWYRAAAAAGMEVTDDLRRLDDAHGREEGERGAEGEAFARMRRDAQLRAAFNFSPFRHREEMDRAREWLIRAAREGQPFAMYLFGRMLREGDAVWGVEADPAQGRTWLEKAARAGVTRGDEMRQER